MEDSVDSEEAQYVDMDEETYQEYKDDFAGFMDEIQSHMKKVAAETSRAPQDMYEAYQAFTSAVDWTESWIRALLCFHVVLLIIVLLTRSNVTIQSGLFLYICFLVFIAERLNTYCRDNWQSFSQQNYFDANGTFAAVLYAGPLLVIALIQMINFLVLASSALIEAKKLELKSKKHKETKKNK